MRCPKRLYKLMSRRRLLALFIVSICMCFAFTIYSYLNISTNLVGVTDKSKLGGVGSTRKPIKSVIDANNPRTARIASYCNFASAINLNDELNIPDNSHNLTLTKVVVVIRHGDRGPLRPVRNLNEINCNDPWKSIDASDKYIKKLNKLISSAKNKLNKILKIPFPLVPPAHRECKLGHLTMFGAIQHVTLGSLLAQAYRSRLSLQSTIHPGDIKVYSTQYPRTFQSAIALVHGFVDPRTSLDYKNFPPIQPTTGTYFCSTPQYCLPNCDKMDHLHRLLDQTKREILESHPAVIKLLSQLRPIISPNKNITNLFNSPVTIFDSLMAYVCHKSDLPCANDGRCITLDHVRQLIAFIDFHGKQLATSATFKHLNWLKIAGFLEELLRHFENVGDRWHKLVLFSAHDITLVPIASVFDVFDGGLPIYASRIVFEVYKHSHGERLYFRVLYNGKDLTRYSEICKADEGNCLQVLNSKKVKSSLIAVEAFRTFITQTFQAMTKATNYKEACGAN